MNARFRLDSSIRCNYFEIFKYLYMRNTDSAWRVNGDFNAQYWYSIYSRTDITFCSKARGNCTFRPSCHTVHCEIEAIITYKVQNIGMNRVTFVQLFAYKKIITCLLWYRNLHRVKKYCNLHTSLYTSGYQS